MIQSGSEQRANGKSSGLGRLFGWYFQSNLLFRILAGLVLGAIFGIAFGPAINWVAPFGEVFVRLLQMIVMPVIIFTLVVGASSIQPSRLGRVGGKAFAFYAVTSAFAVVIGLTLANLLNPGKRLSLEGERGATLTEIQQPDLVDTLLNVIPTNPFGAAASGQVLPVIFVCLVFGIALAVLRDSNSASVKKSVDVAYSLLQAGTEAIFIVVKWVMQYAPIGVFALIATVFAEQGTAAFGPLAKLTGTVYLALAMHLVVVYFGILTVSGLNPISFLAKARSAILTSFVTRSSGGTLPVSMDVAKKNMGVSEGIYSFTLPLGSTINMDGSAIYQGVSVVFIASAVGLPLDLNQQLTVILTAVLASIGTAGVPGAGAIMLLLVLESVGLSVEAGTAVAAAYALVLGIDAMLDMGRTSLNVTGDLAATCVVAKSEGLIDDSAWNGEAASNYPDSTAPVTDE